MSQETKAKANILYWVLGALGVLAVCVLLYYYLKKGKGKEAPHA